METWIAPLAVLFGLSVALLVKSWILRPPSGGAGCSLPPSPRALPLIGHLHLVLGKHLHRAFGEIAREHGPCVSLKFGSSPYLVISSAQAAREAIRVRDSTYSSRPFLTPGKIFGADGILWTPYGEYWRNVRKLCTLELLTLRQIQRSQAARAEEMALAVAKLVEASRGPMPGTVNLTEVISDVTYGMILRKVVGNGHRRNEEALRFKHLLKEVFVAMGDFYVGDIMPWLQWLDLRKAAHAKRLYKQVDEYMQRLVDEQRRKGADIGDDFISIMLRNELFSKSDSFMKAIVLDMIGAGTDTSAVTIEWAMAELINNPSVMSRLLEELHSVVGPSSLKVEEAHLDKLVYLGAVVKETLRLHPPGAILIFQAAQPCQVMDYFVPEGTRVFINNYEIARDERCWEEPLKFKPERFVERNIDIVGLRDFEMLPFGSGRRGCPGIQLGLRVVHFVLANLVHGFEWKNPSGKELDMSEGSGLTLARAVPLELTISPRI
ncbi:(+)-menthofuran synthase [Selaginella moellendorffii]|uniref:(+)-menthofuran synthase n=1 Tax=Selaginella moellendorffii TaxID=88036 RepID=UPI000D1C8783|nr:(+)-menthofuran synthase [Selaginella moellendorffii]|eukprot:XP_024527756.1 (+)-menthofuran synthase [Selaginella moellendorffii]